jgi:multicomponent Na+:H+ antiporter subunit D
MIVPIVFLSFTSLYIGFGAEHIQQVAMRIARELLDNQAYIDAVLKP